MVKLVIHLFITYFSEFTLRKLATLKYSMIWPNDIGPKNYLCEKVFCRIILKLSDDSAKLPNRTMTNNFSIAAINMLSHASRKSGWAMTNKFCYLVKETFGLLLTCNLQHRWQENAFLLFIYLVSRRHFPTT